MMSALPEHGRVGLTAIAESHPDADELYRRAVDVLDSEAEQASAGYNRGTEERS
jgi:hypothetical protein